MRLGRRRKKKHNYLKNIVVLLIISGIIIWIEIEILREMNIKDGEKYLAQKLISYDNKILESESINNNIIKNENITDNTLLNDVPKNNVVKDNMLESKIPDIRNTNSSDNSEKIIDKYKGFTVCGKLEIPKIKLETYILEKFSENALRVSVTKFWGVNPNEIGNCCIAGHNFQNKNMFHNLKKLDVGDRFSIKDNKNRLLEYEIYNLYKVYPEDVSCLSQVTNGKREVTLITCTNDSSQRIIVKAREI